MRAPSISPASPVWAAWSAEVLGDSRTLPDTLGLLESPRRSPRGLSVLPYTNDDPVTQKLEDAGAAAVMRWGRPIGSV